MEVHDKMSGSGKPVERSLDPQTLNFIERIRYYENLTPVEADNDNKNTSSANQGSACFDSWALPEFLRN